MENKSDISPFLESLKKQPFSTPPNYFNQLSDRIQDNVYHQNKYQFSFDALFTKSKYVLALASIVILIFGGILFWNISTKNTNATNEKNEIVEYLKSSEIDTDVIFANHFKRDISPSIKSENQEIINYLVESDIDLSDLTDVIN